MNNVILAILQRLGLGTKAKSFVPAIAGCIGVLVNYLVTGHFNTLSIESAASGLITAIAVYGVPNKSSVPLVKALVEIDHTFAPPHAGAPDKVKV